MKIALIWPHGFDVKYVMPLPLGYLKSNINPRHDVKVIDCSIDGIQAGSPEFTKIIQDFNPDMVCTSCWAPTYKESIRILKISKAIKPDVITVLGGVHVSSYADYIIEHEPWIDFLFRGEADLSFPVFIEEIDSGSKNFTIVKGIMYKDKDGNIIKNETERTDELDKIKIPDYKAMDLQRYVKSGYKFSTLHERNAPVWITRGCPYNCQYCAAPSLNGRLIRAHSIDYSMEWIKYLHNEEKMDHINIIDDNFTFDINYAKEFCHALIKENIGVTMGTPNGIRMQRLDAELVQLMKKAGWENLVVAPESGSIGTLERMKKNLKPEVVPPIVKMIKENGLKVNGFFIIGYPGDTKEDLKQTLEFAQTCNFDFIFLNNFQALPGTPIFDELVKKGEITEDFLPKNYSDGGRSYTPEALKDVNFANVVLSEYMKFYTKSPSKILYAFKLFPPKLIAKKVFKNFMNSIKNQKETVHITDDEFNNILDSMKTGSKIDLHMIQ